MRAFRNVGVAGFLFLSFACSSSAATRYVNVSNATPAAPHASWGSAATDIQSAINEAASGDEILVAPGVYRITEFIEIPSSKTLTLRSTLSREAVIDAQGLCPAMSIYGADSVVEGFTIRNGFSADYAGGITVGPACTVRDCLVTSNRAYSGGGVYFYGSGVVEGCTIQSNVAADWAGGVLFYNHSSGRVVRCVIRDNLSSNYAGGVGWQYGGTVSNCWILGNRAILGNGGGGHMDQGGELVNSVVAGNSSGDRGGGIWTSGTDTDFSTVVNCTIVSNSAANYGGGVFAAYNAKLLNSIIYHNTAPTNDNFYNHNLYSTVSNCCLTPDHGWPNITNAPAFVDAGAGDFRLATASFCIDAGTANGAPGNDIAGNLRPRVGKPGGLPRTDIGAYEYGFHFNDIRFTSPNTLELRWDVQDLGRYRLDAETTGLVQPFWIEDIDVFTSPMMAPGQFAVHTQTVALPPPVPANADFRLRIERSTVGKRRGR